MRLDRSVFTNGRFKTIDLIAIYISGTRLVICPTGGLGQEYVLYCIGLMYVEQSPTWPIVPAQL